MCMSTHLPYTYIHTYIYEYISIYAHIRITNIINPIANTNNFLKTSYTYVSALCNSNSNRTTETVTITVTITTTTYSLLADTLNVA